MLRMKSVVSNNYIQTSKVSQQMKMFWLVLNLLAFKTSRVMNISDSQLLRHVQVILYTANYYKYTSCSITWLLVTPSLRQTIFASISVVNILARPFTEYDVTRGILKWLCKTWKFRAASYSVNSQGIIHVFFFLQSPNTVNICALKLCNILKLP